MLWQTYNSLVPKDRDISHHIYICGAHIGATDDSITQGIKHVPEQICAVFLEKIATVTIFYVFPLPLPSQLTRRYICVSNNICYFSG